MSGEIAICSISKKPFGGIYEHIMEIITHSKYNIVPIEYPPNSLFGKYANLTLLMGGRPDPLRIIYSKNLKKFKIVHVPTPPYLMNLVSNIRKKRKMGFVVTLHSPVSKDILKEQLKDSPTSWNYWDKYYSLISKSINNADAVITVSNWIEKQVAEIYPHLNVKTIPNMIDVQKVRHMTEDYEKIIKTFNLKRDGYIVWLGARINAPNYKRPCDFIEISKKFPNAMFVMPGKNISDDELKSLCGEIPTNLITINTYQYPESKKVYLSIIRGAKFGILTSYYEVFGYTIIEALSINTPVVVPDIGGPPEIVNNEVGLIYKSGDQESLERQVEKMLWDYKRYKETYKYIMKKYDSGIVVNRIDALYDYVSNA